MNPRKSGSPLGWESRELPPEITGEELQPEELIPGAEPYEGLTPDPSIAHDLLPDEIIRTGPDVVPNAPAPPQPVRPTRTVVTPHAPRTPVAPHDLQVGQVMTRAVTTLVSDDLYPADRLLARFRSLRHLPVVDRRGRLVGMLTRPDVLQHALSHGNAEIVVRQLMSTPALSIRIDQTLHEAAHQMLSQHIHALPVIDERGRIAGIVTDSDLLSALAAEKIRAPIEVAEVPVDAVMAHDTHIIAPDATIEDAASMMLENTVRHLPVLDDDGKLVGILSERDIRARIGAPPHEWFNAPREALDDLVSNVMMPDPVAIPSGAPLLAALDALIDEGVGALPVVDDAENVIGLLSYVDVLAWLRAHPPEHLGVH